MPYKPEGNKDYNIVRLWGQQKEILRLVASGLYKNTEVADMIGVTPQTVSNIINSALGKQTLDLLQGAADSDTVDLMVKIRSLAPLALAVQENILTDDATHPRLKNDISNKVLDRAGYMPISKNLNLNLNAGVTAEDLEAIKKRAAELNEVKASHREAS